MKLLDLPTALSLAGILALSACGPSSTTPDGAVMKSVQALKDNDLNALLNCTLTGTELTEARAQWASRALETPEKDEAERFSILMAQLTEPEAETNLMKKLEPQLAKMKPQVDMLLGMLEGMAASAMATNQKLTVQEQAQAKQVVQALVGTLRKNDITDPERARKTIGIACKTARKLELKTTEDVQHLSFEQALERGGFLLAGLKEALAVYGFSIDQLLDSVQARTVTQSGDAATVEIRYMLLGVEYTHQAEMERQAGRWVLRRAPANEAISG